MKFNSQLYAAAAAVKYLAKLSKYLSCAVSGGDYMFSSVWFPSNTSN